MARRRAKLPPISPEARFWAWFHSRAAHLTKLAEHNDGEDDHVLRKLEVEMFMHLDWVHPDLLLAIFKDDGPVAVFSAAGGLANVPLVLRMLAAAPHLPDWKIAAFKTPCINDPRYSLCATTLPTDNIGFVFTPTRIGLQLTIYTVEDPAMNCSMRLWATTLLDQIYGRGFLTKFARVVWRQAPDEFRPEEVVYSLDELGNVLTTIHQGLRYDPVPVG